MTFTPAIGIVDPCAPSGYALSENDAPLGGTEATVIKIAQALQGRFRFFLFQANAHKCQSRCKHAPIPLEHAFQDHGCQGFLVINSWKVACRLRRAHPQKPIALWLHVHPGRHNRQMGKRLASADIDVFCVSKSHCESLKRFLLDGPMPKISHIYNPIADDLTPDTTPRDMNRLFFCSAPHKGLKQVLAQFDALRERLPNLTLEVADPGYLRWDVGPIPDGVWLRGRLPHDRLIARLRRSLCLFYPQDKFSETFGLVIAEANAVGTPVLVQRGLGANDEVTCTAEQLIEANNLDQLEARVRYWQRNFPRLQTDGRFRLIQIAGQWHEALSNMVSVGPGQASENILKPQISYG